LVNSLTILVEIKIKYLTPQLISLVIFNEFIQSPYKLNKHLGGGHRHLRKLNWMPMGAFCEILSFLYFWNCILPLKNVLTMNFLCKSQTRRYVLEAMHRLCSIAQESPSPLLALSIFISHCQTRQGI
jgi:hypothetical protein